MVPHSSDRPLTRLSQTSAVPVHQRSGAPLGEQDQLHRVRRLGSAALVPALTHIEGSVAGAASPKTRLHREHQRRRAAAVAALGQAEEHQA